MKNIFISFIYSFVFIICTDSQVFSQGIWTQKANIPAGALNEASAFSIGTKGYVGASIQDLWEYDQATDSWTQMATFTGPVRYSAAGFSIGSKGYFGTGGSYNDFYEWDQTTNTWTQKAGFGGTGREGAIGFATSTKGYIGTGGNYLADLWEYDPVLNAWTQMASIPGPGRYHAAAWAINDKGYVCTGFNGSFLNDLWEFDPIGNSWVQMASLPGNTRDRPEGFAIGNKGYLGVGWDGSNALNDFYEWDQPTNTWTTLPSLAGSARYNAISFALGTKAYIGLGLTSSGTGNDLWEYAPSCVLQATTTGTTCNNACDGTSTVTLPVPGAVVSYSWNTSPIQTTQTATGLCAAVYSVTMTDTAGCINTISVTIPAPTAIVATSTSTVPSCYGLSDGSLCASVTGGSGTYSGYTWSNGQTTNCASGLSAGTYTVTVTDNNGCTGSSSLILTQPTQMIASLSHTNATCPTCANGNATANISGGNGPYTFSWSNGVTNSAFITGLLPGTYTCCITDINGCTVCDSTIITSPSNINSNSLIQSIVCAPVPFNDYIMVDLREIKENVIIFNLTDISGKALYREEIKNMHKQYRIKTDFLETGIYFLFIQADNKKSVLKILKN